MKHAVKHIHFVGIGGAGMSGIAEILHNLGYASRAATRRQRHHRSAWPRWACAWLHRPRRAHIAGAEAVVTSTAVKADNPEVIAARARASRWCRAP
jgi:UDP-N-acetylmuramate--alanine ligase